jgi:uncharacterized protein YdeI (YjbR/CyaY-like superfamily)
MNDEIDLADRNDWRNWLAQNHSKKDHSWLTVRKKNSSNKGVNLEEAVEEAICFGWIDGKLRKLDDKRFLLRFRPRKANSVWSKINKERAEKLIEAGRMMPEGLATIKRAKISGAWDCAYTSKTTDPVPADLEVALMMNEPAWSNFQKFANSHRNMYIGWIAAAKTKETRTRRIERVTELARQNKKTILQ